MESFRSKFKAEQETWPGGKLGKQWMTWADREREQPEAWTDSVRQDLSKEAENLAEPVLVMAK